MSKAILVMDMPKNCAECKFCTSHYCTYSCIADEQKNLLPSSYASHNATGKPDWCHLREVPQKKEELNPLGYSTGWNDCIDKILKGSEENG